MGGSKPNVELTDRPRRRRWVGPANRAATNTATRGVEKQSTPRQKAGGVGAFMAFVFLQPTAVSRVKPADGAGTCNRRDHAKRSGPHAQTRSIPLLLLLPFRRCSSWRLFPRSSCASCFLPLSPRLHERSHAGSTSASFLPKEENKPPDSEKNGRYLAKKHTTRQRRTTAADDTACPAPSLPT